ncbi:hypothetical protein HELRODRAFT_174082 [Helobdella robusta]|uniref:Uncharacterized protein n=1 Tax=Helobdella robusta TaxID=6412 RepID=T1F7K9_HELRO|nr:hypothetical protein HELRODRAFT_174082 [Helobdella robusta]ESO03184.1 hypothetical protein HELRODRAFT_174082 [Helobdella robusta]
MNINKTSINRINGRYINHDSYHTCNNHIDHINYNSHIHINHINYNSQIHINHINYNSHNHINHINYNSHIHINRINYSSRNVQPHQPQHQSEQQPSHAIRSQELAFSMLSTK